MIKKIRRKLFFMRHEQMAGRVAYKMGAKPNRITDAPSRIHEIDCSGYSQWLAFNSGGDLWPAGSWNQLDWFLKLSEQPESGVRRIAKYANVGLPEVRADESRIFVAFVKPVYLGKKLLKAGHVWFVSGGKTYESCGGKGVCSRPWNLSFTKLRETFVFELPTQWE